MIWTETTTVLPANHVMIEAPEIPSSKCRRSNKHLPIIATGWAVFAAVAIATCVGEALLGAALWQILVSVAAELLAFGLIVLGYEQSVAPELPNGH